MAEQAKQVLSNRLTWVQDEVDAGNHVWAIVDASAELPRQIRLALDRASPAINLFEHSTSDEAALALAPRLILVHPQHGPSAITHLWLEQPADEPVIFFVSTSMSNPAFEHAVRQRVRAELPDGEVMLFRWWDARIWWALNQLPQIEHPEIASFFRVFMRSLSLSRNGEMHTHAYNQASVVSVTDQLPIKLSEGTFSRLLAFGEADAVLGICRDHYPSALDAVLPAQRHALACAQISWARAEGFSAPNDHALATRIAAEWGPNWHQRAEWLRVVEVARTQGRTLLSTVAAY